MSVYPTLHVDKPLTRKRRKAFDERALDLLTDWGRLYVVDRPGLEQNQPNIDAFQDLAREGSLWLDIGPVQAEDVMDTIVSGAERVTVRWDKVWDRAEMLDGLDMASEGIFVGLPFDDDWAENRREGAPVVRDLADEIADLDGGLLLIDEQRAGTADGFRDSRCPDPMRLDVPVWVAGGVQGPREANRLLEKGFEGVLVGTAIDEFIPEEWS